MLNKDCGMALSKVPEAALAALVDGVVKDIMVRLEPLLREQAMILGRNMMAAQYREFAHQLDAQPLTRSTQVATEVAPSTRLSQRARIIQVLMERGNKPIEMQALLHAVAGDGDTGSTRKAISRMKNTVGHEGEVAPELVETRSGRLKLSRIVES